MNYKKTLSVFYILLVLFCLSLIAYIANYLYASTIDGNFNSFYKTAIQSLKLNYFRLNGRWAQGLTNDYRFHTNRLIVTTINNAFFVFSIYYLVKNIFIKHTVIIAVVIYFSFLYNAHNLYQVTHLLNTSLSYTFGMSLMNIFFGLYFREQKVKDKFTLPLIIFSLFILLFITGLVEHLFMIMLLILGFIVFYEVVFYRKKVLKKPPFLKISYVLITLIGSLLVVFSVGSRSRRASTSARLEQTDYAGIFNFNRYLNSLGAEILDQLNLNSLLFFMVMIVAFYILKKQDNSLFFKDNKKPKAILWLLFSFVLVITPITVGFLASNGKVGMPKAYNLTAILFLLFLSVGAYLINVFFKIKLGKLAINTIFTLPLLFYFSAYFIPINNLYKQKDQVFSGNLKASSEEVFAQRQYLVETNSIFKEKVIPQLSKKYHNKVYAAHKYSKMNQYYNRAFNNGIPVYTDSNLPSPLEFTSIFLAKNNKIKPIFSQGEYEVFYNKQLHTLVFSCNESLFNSTKSKFNIIATLANKEIKQIVLDVDKVKQERPQFYREEPNYVSITLPDNTIEIEIKELDNCKLNFQNPLMDGKINYIYNYGNLMR